MSSSEKPAHLGPAYAAQFQDAAVVAAYPYRPAVPDAVLSVLTGLVSSPGSGPRVWPRRALAPAGTAPRLG